MGCERYDRDLALYVEGDLPEAEAASVTRHLEGCGRCRSFLSALEHSQRGVKDLASQPDDDIALAAVRTRVLAAVRDRGAAPTPPVVAWRWGLVAALVCLVGTAALFFRPRSEPRSRASVSTTAVETGGGAPGNTAPSTRPAGPVLSTPARGGRSTVQPVRSVSRGMEHLEPIESLAPEEADQLARAVLAVSRVHRLSDLRFSEPPEPVELPAPGQVVLATADPNVVIHWQLDPNGG